MSLTSIVSSRQLRYRIGLAVLSFIVLGMACVGRALTVQATSPRVGFLFSDQEPMDMRARVTEAQAPVTIEYAVSEMEGAWKTNGTITMAQLDNGVGEQAIPLHVPGRGLYQLTLRAHSGTANTESSTWVGVTFTQEAPDPESPWGMFCWPWDRKRVPDADEAMAANMRQLGVSWVRYNFWAGTYGTVTVSADGNSAHASLETAKASIAALHRHNLFIMGEIAMCPRVLSSQPTETAVSGDSGPLWARVKPQSYAQWDSMIEQIGRQFREEIQYWEILNEPDLKNRYWSGTPEEFVEFVAHTSAAFKRGNPQARIVISGFTPNGQDFAENLLQLGIGKYIDIFSVHYSDGSPNAIMRWQALLNKYQLNVPIWNTEERSEVPVNNLAAGYSHTIKFLHVGFTPDYNSYRPILRNDYTVTPSGLLYAAGAHCLGTARYLSQSDQIAGWQIAFFQRGDERIAVIRSQSPTAQPVQLTFTVDALPQTHPMITDSLGRSRSLDIVNGKTVVSFIPAQQSTWFINGCRRLDLSIPR